MSNWDESKHKRNKIGRFAEMSAKEISEELKEEISDSDNFIDKNLKNHYDWAVKNGKVSALISFSDYVNIADKLNKIAVGKVAADGTLIKKVSNHSIDRVCGTTEYEKGVKHEGIPLEDFKDTLFNGKVKRIVKTNTIIYIYGKCKIAINSENGVIKQCNKN